MPVQKGILEGWNDRRDRVRQEAKAAQQLKRDEEEVTKGLGARVLARGDIDRMLRTVQEAKERGEQWLALLDVAAGTYVDEVALLLPEGNNGDNWFECMLNRVGQRGITYFNQSNDTVKCQPLPSTYDVRYDFFATDLGVRLELLRLRGGYSPLHDLYRRDGRASSNNADVVHVSFKVPTEEDLRSVEAQLRSYGWMLGQSCESQYGRFGYWRNPRDEGPLLWLKPRVNLRDLPNPFGEDPPGIPDYDAEEDEEELEDDDL